MTGLAPGDHRRQEDAGGDERGRHPEDRQLHVPGAHQVVREDLREVDAEEARDVGAVVLRGGAEHALQQEQGAHDEEEPGRRALRGVQRNVAGRAEQRRLLAPVPAEVPPQRPNAPNRIPIPPSRAISDKTDHTITFARLARCRPAARRPVVRVRVVVAGPVRRRRPAVQAKNAVSCRSSVRSVIASGRKPCRVVGSEKKSL